MKVEFRRSFARDLRAVKDKGVLQRVREMIEEVEHANSPSEILNLKKLKASGDYYRIRVGSYRAGIALSDETIVFVRLLNRKDIYRYFP